MTIVNIAAQVESMLKASFQSALTAAGAADCVFRTFWLDDDSEATTEAIKFPCVLLQAAPDRPSDHQSPLRTVTVLIRIMTELAKDRKRAVLGELYGAIRDDVDTADFSSASFDAVEVTVTADSEVGVDEAERGPINRVDLYVDVELCYTG